MRYLKVTGAIVAIALAMALSFGLGWYMNGFIIYKGIFAGQVSLMPEINGKN